MAGMTLAARPCYRWHKSPRGVLSMAGETQKICAELAHMKKEDLLVEHFKLSSITIVADSRFSMLRRAKGGGVQKMGSDIGQLRFRCTHHAMRGVFSGSPIFNYAQHMNMHYPPPAGDQSASSFVVGCLQVAAPRAAGRSLNCHTARVGPRGAAVRPGVAGAAAGVATLRPRARRQTPGCSGNCPFKVYFSY